MYYNPVNEILDAWTLAFIRVYFFPFFVAGIADNIKDITSPRTYSICKI